MKVLFAVSNDNITTSVVSKYQQKYKEIITSRNVYYFNAIIKELQRDKTYDAIVIGEDLEPISNNNYEAIDKFLLEKLDSISDEASKPTGEDIPIIFICADRRSKNDQILRKMFSMSIYNALVGNDRSLNMVCNLINKPRNKKEAKRYYQMEAEQAEYEVENENLVSEAQIQSILSYYNRIGTNEKKCVQAFDSIARQYDDTQLRIIVKFLPMQVKAILETGSPRYQKLMTGGTVLSNGQYSQYTHTPANKPKKLDFIETDLEKTKMNKPVVIPSAMKLTRIPENQGMPNNQQTMNRNVQPQMAGTQYPNYNNMNASGQMQNINPNQFMNHQMQPGMYNPNPNNTPNNQQFMQTQAAPQNNAYNTGNVTNQSSNINATSLNENQNSNNNLNNNIGIDYLPPVEVEPFKPTETEKSFSEETSSTNNQNVQEQAAVPVKRGRGRPRKIRPESENSSQETAKPEVKRGRGRPRKVVHGNLSELTANKKEENIENTQSEIIAPNTDLEQANGLNQNQATLNNAQNTQIADLNGTTDTLDVEGKNENSPNTLNQMDEMNQNPFATNMNNTINNESNPFEENLNNSEYYNNGMPASNDNLFGTNFASDDNWMNQTLNNNPFAENMDFGMPQSNNINNQQENQKIKPEDYVNINTNTHLENVNSRDIFNTNNMNNMNSMMNNTANQTNELEQSNFMDQLPFGVQTPNQNQNYDIYGMRNNFESNNEFGENNTENRIVNGNENRYNNEYNQNSMSIAGNGKIVAFVGTTKNGTSFVVNNLAQLLSQKGIKTAILDLTKNKNAYYMFTDNDSQLMKIATESIKKLSYGEIRGIDVSKNLTVFTALPEEVNTQQWNNEAIINNLSSNFEVILIDCDFETDTFYFVNAQEIYLIQSMDAFTIQPLTKFLSDLKMKNILEEEKLRVIINKHVKMKRLTASMVVGGMSKYNEPSMTLQRDLFNPENIKTLTIPFEEQSYAKYLESIAMCQLSLNGYSQNFIQSLENLANSVYPLIAGGNQRRNTGYGNYDNNSNNQKRMFGARKNDTKFSNNVNSTLDKMRTNNY